MIKLHQSMVLGRQQTGDPWICSRTGYQLRYGAMVTACFGLEVRNSFQICTLILRPDIMPVLWPIPW